MQELLKTKRNLFTLLFTFLFYVLPLNIHAQSKDSAALNNLIKKNIFRYNDTAFTGPGWDILEKEIRKVQFVMIGEQHGEAEIPMFTGKVAEIFKPKFFVAEIDPYAAERLKKVAANPSGDAGYFHKWPYDLAFYCWETEMKLARQLQSDKVDIWGLNEITFMSNGLFFEQLSSVAKIPANKKLAMEKSIECQRNDQLLYSDLVKKWNDFSFFKLTTGYIDSLLYTFRNDNDESKKMLLDLKASRPLLGDNYPLRVNMMKKNLLNYVAPYIGNDSISIPKLLFKFGAFHVSRSNDLTNNFEMGNLADGLAAAGGKKTLHILIFGKKGTINTMLSTDNNIAIAPYDVKADKDLKVLNPFYDQVNDGEWAVFDIRPIRRAIAGGQLTGINAGLSDFMKGFDLVVVFGSTTGNKFIH